MAYETKPNTGSLFKNDRKESDTHADYKGQAVIGGVEFWLDAWINESSNGTKYMALKFKPKDARQAGARQDGNAFNTNAFGSGPQDETPF